MKPYHKIQTVWLRDPENNYKTLLRGRWATPEFEYLRDCNWVFTEKVDGTNIRINLHEDNWSAGGRTDNAQIPTFLYDRLKEIGESAIGKVGPMTLYGEGYGKKIQKGGGNYKSDGVDFILFDVCCDGVWLERENVEDIAAKLSLKCVPILEYGTLRYAIDIVEEGFFSKWGDFPAEGLIMRPETEIQDRLGNRIIAKVKCKDFQ